MADIRISELQSLKELSGEEIIPVEINGESKKIQTNQLIQIADVHHLPKLEAISGNEEIVVVKDGKDYLSTLTQIRQVVLPGYTYEDLTMDKFPLLLGGINSNNRFKTDILMRYEIPITKKNTVFTIKLAKAILPTVVSYFGFTTKSLSGLINGAVIPYAGESEGLGWSYKAGVGEIMTLMAPDDAAFLVINSNVDYNGMPYDVTWEIQIGELIEDKLDDLSLRVQTLEQSAIAPASLDSVSREEFDAMKDELAMLKSKIQ